MKKTRLFIITLAVFMLVPSVVLAFSVKTDNSIYVPSGETVEGNLYAAGSSITIDGTVNGDIICGARSLNINGEVKGDIICAAQNINLRGDIKGSVRLASENATIDSKIQKGLQFFGATLILGQSSEVGWDAFVAAETVNAQGKINGDLHGGLTQAQISGEVGKDVRLRIDQRPRIKDPLLVTESAIIQGNLFYTASHEGKINEGATINGDYGFTEKKQAITQKDVLNKFWTFIISLFSALIVGLVLITIAKSQLEKSSKSIIEKPLGALGWGVAIMFLAPLCCIIMLATIIGIPLALIALAAWISALYISKIVTGIALGKIINDKYRQEKPLSPVWQMIVGIVATWILINVPFLGWVLALFAIWLGLGGLWLSFKKEN